MRVAIDQGDRRRQLFCTAALIGACLAPNLSFAQGVPTVDPKADLLQSQVLTAEQAKAVAAAEKSKTETTLASLHQDQLNALDATLAALSGSSTFGADFEGLSGMEAADVYAIEDNNPYAARLFGDASSGVEDMIIETAKRYAGHPALSAAGINPMEFRCWFQGLVKQESNFSIGARSSAAAFGLTQIIPGTAKDLGIYPTYYDDPRLQLDGGARYLLGQLNRFHSMPLALAAYNAGPGAVIKYHGVPPYTETQNYVVRITANYNTYASRITGVDSVGSLDPRDVAIANASNVSDAGMHYGMTTMTEVGLSVQRLKAIVEKIPNTTDAKEALDLNTYARAEVARIASMVSRLKAARAKVAQAKYALLLQAYARDAAFLDIKDGK